MFSPSHIFEGYCIVMDIVEGCDLREYMQNFSQPLSKNHVMECFIKLTEVSTLLLLFLL